MGKRTLWTGIIAGAVVGGLVTLFNEETREYVKETAGKTYDNASFYVTNPDIGVRKVKHGVENVNQIVSSNMDSAMNALTQVENSLQKFLK